MLRRVFKKVININSVCVYCGFPAQARDHFLCYFRTRLPYYLPSCTLCNGLLNALLVDTMFKRLTYLSRKISKRYKTILPVDYQYVNERNNITKGTLFKQFKAEKEIQKMAKLKLAWIDLAQDIIGDIKLYDLPNDVGLKSRITEFIYANK